MNQQRIAALASSYATAVKAQHMRANTPLDEVELRDAYEAGAKAAFEMSSDADHSALVEYIHSAIRRGDWHAVSDAANDLRVLEASRR